jgi:hypothetical protein
MQITHCACGEPITTGDKCEKCMKNPLRSTMAYYGNMNPQELDAYEWAKDYLGYCVKEGALEPEELDGKNVKEMIALAHTLDDRANDQYESMKENV